MPYAQNPELAERGRRRVGHFFHMLDARLSESDFVAGPAFTVADIAAMVAVDFAAWVKATPPESAKSLRARYERGLARRRRLSLGGGTSGSLGANNRYLGVRHRIMVAAPYGTPLLE